MVRRLKTHMTSLGFFDQAIAALLKFHIQIDTTFSV
jgi:hypothetical protein